MAPSRGCLRLLRGLHHDPNKFSLSIQRQYSSLISNFTALGQQVTNPANNNQTYVSRSLDPFLNLSIEHYLLQKSPPESTILFLYTNRPSIILGRNQNPWVEVNLRLLKQDPLGIDLVRRRSGGGTVFHDEGNVNYSVICPTSAFDRDRHAEMVVRALRKLAIPDARVNERHDIVVDCGTTGPPLDNSSNTKTPFKISGSAYKLTRLRSLHHGTCLLDSPNLGRIGQFLTSPVKAFIAARGVESVSSPVMNVSLPNDAFEDEVIKEFGILYEHTDPVYVDGQSMLSSEQSAALAEITKGYNELKSLDWIYGQTPQFTFSAPSGSGTTTEFTARNGIITEARSKEESITSNENKGQILELLGKKLYGPEADPALLALLQAA